MERQTSSSSGSSLSSYDLSKTGVYLTESKFRDSDEESDNIKYNMSPLGSRHTEENSTSSSSQSVERSLAFHSGNSQGASSSKSSSGGSSFGFSAEGSAPPSNSNINVIPEDNSSNKKEGEEARNAEQPSPVCVLLPLLCG